MRSQKSHQQQSHAYSMNKYLESNRDYDEGNPTMDFMMKDRYSRVSDRFPEALTQQKSLQMQQHDGISKYRSMEVNRPTSQIMEPLNSRIKTGLRSRVNNLSVDKPNYRTYETPTFDYKQYDQSQLLGNQSQIQDSYLNYSPFKKYYKPHQIGISSNKEKAINNYLFSGGQVNISQQADIEYKLSLNQQYRINHQKPFLRFSKIQRESKDQPSIIRMSKQIDNPIEQKHTPWVMFVKIREAQQKFLKQEKFKDPDPNERDHQQSSMQQKKRQFLWFRGLKAHDWDKSFGQSNSLGNQQNYY